MSIPEIRRLFYRLLLAWVRPIAWVLAWSAWRRHHQAVARACHIKRRAFSYAATLPL